MKQKIFTYLFISLFAFTLFSCAGSGTKTNGEKLVAVVSSEPKTLAEAEENWQSNIGVGSISSFELPTSIDNALAEHGKAVYDAKCTACHKLEKNFIGPAPKGIFARRTPAWVMNMILDPEKMIVQDPIAKQLFIKFNGAPMANQNLTEDDARAVLEYFRTL